jgi:hypothetical protein
MEDVETGEVWIESLEFKTFKSILYPDMKFKGGTFRFRESGKTDTMIEFITRKISIKAEDGVIIKEYDSVVFLNAQANE